MAAPKTPDKRLQSPSPQQPSEPGSAKSKDRYDKLEEALHLLTMIRHDMKSVNMMKKALENENNKKDPDKRKMTSITKMMKRTKGRINRRLDKVSNTVRYLVTEENIDQVQGELEREKREIFLMDDCPPVEVPKLRMWCI